MAVIYQITLANGTFLAAIPEDSINNTATSLDLFGRGLTEYGERLQNNIVHILENFAGSSQPRNPLTGQLWYDTTVGTIKVFNGVSFVDLKEVPNGAITNDTIATNAAIDLTKLAKSSSPGQIIVTDGANFARYIAMTGDVTINNKGKTTITKDITVGVSGAVSGTAQQDNLDSFSISTILANNIVASNNIKNFAVSQNKIEGSSISEDKLLANIISTEKIQDGAVTGDKLGASSVTANKIADGSIEAQHLTNGIVTASIIANGALESQHFTASSIAGTFIQDLAISNSKLQDGAVTEDKLASSSVTVDKLAHNNTAAPDFVLSYTGSSLAFVQFGGGLLEDFTISAQKLIHPFLTADYGALVATPFPNEVTSQDLATTQAINISYGGIA